VEAASSVATPQTSLGSALGPVFLVAFLAIFAATGLLSLQHAIWQDESMLMANLGVGWAGYFAPLPYYDQAAPPLATATLAAMMQASDGNLFVMRALVLTLALASFAVLLWLAVRRRVPVFAYAVLIVTSGYLTARNATEIKHYLFELLATLVLLAAYLLARNVGSLRHGVVFFALALVLSFFAYPAFLIVFPILADIVLVRTRGRQRLFWIAGAVAYGLVWIAAYLGIFKPQIALQIANYTTLYGGSLIPEAVRAGDLHGLAMIVRALLGAQPYVTAGVAILALLSIGLSLARARLKPSSSMAQAMLEPGQAPVRLFVLVYGELLLLNLAGLYPLSSPRQLTFTMPVTALLLAWAIGWALARVPSVKRREWIAAAILLPAMLFHLGYAAVTGFERQDTAGLYAFLQKGGYRTVLPWIQFQPSLAYYEQQGGRADYRIAGALTEASQPLPSREEAIALLAAGDRPVPQQIWALIPNEEMRHYTDWLARQVPRNEVAVIATAQMTAEEEAMLRRSLDEVSCTGRTVFASTDVKAIETNCAPKSAQSSTQ
jgi:hypothetical protein